MSTYIISKAYSILYARVQYIKGRSEHKRSAACANSRPQNNIPKHIWRYDENHGNEDTSSLLLSHIQEGTSETDNYLSLLFKILYDFT